MKPRLVAYSLLGGDMALSSKRFYHLFGQPRLITSVQLSSFVLGQSANIGLYATLLKPDVSKD